ncbi:hypothetical protein NHP21005_19290 (plasmid) [Helicobacter sp. NHP21005]|uniref:hypothetical protein n=1 Tax=Helicobacter felistomachi TaxID=3040201 RepID=UPI0025722F76|nr:hypothetical protein [Helicobacter sp. NHP21005]BEG58241.1 hypothetical protein NHP21005_19290 [Helicobacter sp. NHP21005]
MLDNSGNASNDNASNVSHQSSDTTPNTQNKNIKPQPKLLNEKSTRELGKLIGKLEEQIIKIENEKNTLENSLKNLMISSMT